MVYQLSEEDKKMLAPESNQEQILSLLQEYEEMKNNNKKEDIKVLKLNLWSKIVSWFCGNIFLFRGESIGKEFMFIVYPKNIVIDFFFGVTISIENL